MTDGRPLEHPLPLGMRDLLPEEAEARRALTGAVLERVALYGYRLVTPPAFELAEVLERGLKDATEDAGRTDDLLRFIEPDSGAVAVLRPDITPQVARIVATRLRDRAPPFRLAYEGTVVRRRSSRARKHRQVPQVGVELFGVAGAEGELELLTVAADVLRRAGLERFTIDLADAGIVRALLDGAPPATVRDVSRALSRKDEPALAELCRDLPEGARIRELAHLHGGREAIVEANALLRGTLAEAPAARLSTLFDAAAARDLGSVLSVDPGEVRSYAYYTGTIFSIYARGAGEPIGGGGRYDDLLARYGAPLPAIGVGLDLDALAAALAAQAAEKGDATRGGPNPGRGVVLVGRADDPRALELRARGIAVVAAENAEGARDYAASWGFAWVWDDEAKTTTDEVVRMLKSGPSAVVRPRGA